MFLPAIEQATPFNHALVRIQVEFRVLPKVLEEAVGLSGDHLVVELVKHKRGRSMSCHQLPLARRERHPVAAGRDLVEGQSVQGKTMPTVPSREAAACPNQQQPVPIQLASAMAESAPAAAHFVALPLSPPDLPQERLVLKPPACRVAIKWYCGREGILNPPAGCAAARLFSRTIDAAHS